MTQFNDLHKQYIDICNQIADFFTTKYFKNYSERWWIGDDVGGVMGINDYFFTMDDMLDYLKYKYSFKLMDKHYWYTIDAYEKKKTRICIRDYKKLKR